MSFTFIDLFAGIGGFHAALEPIGGKCVFVSEIDQFAGEIYKNNWLKNRPIQVSGDIRLLTENIKANIPSHDVLTAGFPCQPFSKSGNQLGVNEARGTLFYNILQIIEERKPKIIAVSDEPTILSPHEIPKKFGGTPQHRDRVFIGAIKVGEKRAQELTDLGPLLSRKPFKKFGEPIWNINETLEEISSTDDIDHQSISLEKKNALKMWNEFLLTYREFNNANPPGLPMWSEFWDLRKNISIPRSVPDWKKQFILKNIEIYESNKSWINKWRDKHELNSHIPSNRKFEWQGRDQKDIFKCLIQFRPSGIRVKEPTYVPAFVALTQTPVLGWEKRELSVYEASQLQGFPPNFTFEGQRNSLSFKQIGNAVHPGSARLVFNAIIQRAEMLKMPWASDFLISSQKYPIPPKTVINQA